MKDPLGLRAGMPSITTRAELQMREAQTALPAAVPKLEMEGPLADAIRSNVADVNASRIRELHARLEAKRQDVLSQHTLAVLKGRARQHFGR